MPSAVASLQITHMCKSVLCWLNTTQIKTRAINREPKHAPKQLSVSPDYSPLALFLLFRHTVSNSRNPLRPVLPSPIWPFLVFLIFLKYSVMAAGQTGWSLSLCLGTLYPFPIAASSFCLSGGWWDSSEYGICHCHCGAPTALNSGRRLLSVS